MPSVIKIVGRVRQILQAIDQAAAGDEQQPFTLTEQLEMLAAQSTTPYQEITRTGRAFKVQTTAAVAAVVAVPSTAQMFAIYNNAPDGGRSLILDRIWALNAVSTAVAGQAGLLGLIGQVRETPPTDSGMLIRKLNGMGGGAPDTVARTILTATALPATTGIAADWFPLGPNVSKSGAAATPGYQLEELVQGHIIVAPGRYFAMHVMAMVVGETFLAGIEWHEKQLRLG